MLLFAGCTRASLNWALDYLLQTTLETWGDRLHYNAHREICPVIKVAQNSNISVRSLGSNAHISDHPRSREITREIESLQNSQQTWRRALMPTS